ncbi:MAG: hypothetical protein ACRC18_06775 [Cetobacterium sp.]
MFNKKLIAKIVLNHQKFIESEKDSCDIVHMSTKEYLTDEENKKLKYHLESACDLLRKAYKMRWEEKNE